ncbi:VC1465 family Xer recombination activation factor [Nitrosomonas sp. wSCUT-2]
MKKCRNRRKPFKPVSHEKLRETRILSGLSKEEAAEMLRVTYRTLHNWESGRVQVPYAAFKLLHILTGYELPSDAWRGWKFSGEVLWSPEGKKFTAADLNYLSLTFAMAKQWRLEREEKRNSGLHPERSNLLPFVRPKNGRKENSSIG